jgi:hypothetical protein
MQNISIRIEPNGASFINIKRDSDLSPIAGELLSFSGETAAPARFIKIGADGNALPADYAGTDHVAVYVASRNIWVTARKIHAKRQKWAAGEKLCAALTLLGFKDWRYPDLEDLEAIRDLTKHDPAADTNYFPDIDAASHWTRTPWAADPSSVAWYLLFDSGYAYTYLRNYECFVLAVRPAGVPGQSFAL